MTQPKINLLLVATILVMTLCPMVASLYFVDRALSTSLNLGFNAEIVEALQQDAMNLKALGRMDPEHADQYRADFERVENLKSVYGSSEYFKKSLRHSLLIYFAVGALAAVALSVALATCLSRRISHSFTVTFDELTKQREKVRYLEGLASWQELAKMLAHEIRNPLTPIEVSVTALGAAHANRSHEQFAEQLTHTQSIVLEELAHLNNIVSRFSDFAKLPNVELTAANVAEVLERDARAIERTIDRARCVMVVPETATALRAKIDATLFRQVFTNLIRNGVEANPGRDVTFTWNVGQADGSLTVTVVNDGVPVPVELAPKIFDPYISDKSGNDNMGLGLAIARKIVIEHGGDLSYAERDGHPAFIITLPVV